MRLRLSIGLCACAAVLALSAGPASAHGLTKPRTVVTNDMEQDDYASLIRYLLYTDDVDNEGIVYTSSRFHWAGDGKGTPFFLPGREYTTPQTSWRWTGTQTIQDQVIPAYAQVYPNLKRQDSQYPSPSDLQSIVKIGNVDFEGEMDHDTPGSDLIKNLLLDNDPRQLFAAGASGTQLAPWMSSGHLYLFVLQDANGYEIARDQSDLRQKRTYRSR